SKGRPRVGVGIAVFNEHSGPGSAVYRGRGVTEVPGYDAARVVFEEGGTFSAYISSADAGQRHAAVCRVQVAKALSVDPSLVNVVEGDTASCPVGTGTFASRFAVKQVGAAVVAADRMAGRLHRAAAAYLDCSPGDVQQTEGGYERRGSGGQVSFSALSEWLYRPPGGIGRLERVRETEAPVEELGFSDGDSTLPCGALLTVVEVDAETFIPKVRTIKIVEECGRVLDRSAVFGQLEGGAIMGLGDALLGEHLYDESGEITTSSLMDYLLPMIGDAPRVEVFLLDDETLYTKRSETGSKGVGEAGTIGAVASIGCAVSDALRSLGGTLNELPATPLRVFKACQSSDSSQRAAAAGPTGEPATS
ncbi:MAG: xanthine dehydrogenase family protein molybdopterin-binding subunit, partial [Streptosporangiaceae bacterium]